MSALKTKQPSLNDNNKNGGLFGEWGFIPQQVVLASIEITGRKHMREAMPLVEVKRLEGMTRRVNITKEEFAPDVFQSFEFFEVKYKGKKRIAAAQLPMLPSY